jgi:hypothetical protein
MSSKQDIIYGMGLIILALQVTAISSPQWSMCKDEQKKKDLNLTKLENDVGLWKSCLVATGDIGNLNKTLKGKAELDTCIHLPPDDNTIYDKFPKNSLEAVRAFALMGPLFIFLGLMCMMYMKAWKRCPMVFLLLGGLFSLIANIIWFAEFRKLNIALDNKPSIEAKYSVGYSFYLNMAGGIFGLLAAAYYYYGN